MIKGTLYRDGVPEGEQIEPSAIGTLADGEWCWFDVVDPTVVDLSALQAELGLHPLAVCPVALGMMAVASTALYVVFKRNDWL